MQGTINYSTGAEEKIQGSCLQNLAAQTKPVAGAFKVRPPEC
jgi:hypothetical protein